MSPANAGWKTVVMLSEGNYLRICISHTVGYIFTYKLYWQKHLVLKFKMKTQSSSGQNANHLRLNIVPPYEYDKALAFWLLSIVLPSLSTNIVNEVSTRQWGNNNETQNFTHSGSFLQYHRLKKELYNPPPSIEETETKIANQRTGMYNVQAEEVLVGSQCIICTFCFSCCWRHHINYLSVSTPAPSAPLPTQVSVEQSLKIL